MIVLLGFISPLYRIYPSIVQVLLAFNIVSLNILALLGCTYIPFYFGVMVFYALNIIFIYELWNTLLNPFCSTTNKNLRYSIIIMALSLDVVYLFENNQKIMQNTIQTMYQQGICISILFTMKVSYHLKSTSKLQDKAVNSLKNTYFKRQAIWFITICLFQIFCVYDDDLEYILFSVIGIFFAFNQLSQSFPLLRLRAFFCREVEKLNLIHQLETQQINDYEYTLPVIQLKNAQIQELIRGILIGVQKSIQQQWESKKWSSERTYKFKGNLDSLTQITIKCYHPDDLISLMKQQFISLEQFQNSLDLLQNQEAFSSTKQSMGKSGAFFFFSQNKKLILKTLTKAELQGFLNKRILTYLQYINQNPETTIARIFGLFKVQLVSFQKVYLVLMENTFEQLNLLKGPDRIYDLKGSTKNRTSKQGPLKDNNYLISEDYPIELNNALRLKLIQQLNNDTRLLRSLGYMDYSLLTGIKDDDIQYGDIFPRQIQSIGKIVGFGLIDYLQEFHFGKQLELGWKQLWTERRKLSCVNPEEYQDRFIGFLEEIVVD